LQRSSRKNFARKSNGKNRRKQTARNPLPALESGETVVESSGGKRWENNPRFLKFQKIYLAKGNAYRSMIEAGYSESTASSKCSEFKDRVAIKLARVLRANELDEWRLAAKYRDLLEAKTLKFDPKTGERVLLEASNVQLQTAIQIQKTLEPPPSSDVSPSDTQNFQTVVLITTCPRPDRSKQNTKKIAPLEMVNVETDEGD
jgi:phage terminase small subunit